MPATMYSPFCRNPRPEPGSLHDIMRQHSGVSLYVLPICWTDTHSRLLGAEFIALPPILTPVPDTLSPSRKESPPRPSAIARVLSNELTTFLINPAARPLPTVTAIRIIMGTLFPTTLSRTRTSAEMNLVFGGRVIRKAVRVHVLWKHPEAVGSSFDSAITRPASSFGHLPSSGAPSSSVSGESQPEITSSPPILAYMNCGYLAHLRSRLFRVAVGPDDGDRCNTPVRRLQQLRSKLLVPAEADCDAHLLGVLIAMAQAQFYHTSSQSSSQTPESSAKSQGLPAQSSPRSSCSVKVKLLTHSADPAEFTVYTANFSPTFLRRFENPYKCPPGAQGIKVEYTKVPIWPLLGLKERLGKALGADIAGETFDDTSDANYETWETAEERDTRLQDCCKSHKRSRSERDALAEVFNNSFDVDSQEAEELLSPRGTKRRCPNPVPPPLEQVC